MARTGGVKTHGPEPRRPWGMVLPGLLVLSVLGTGLLLAHHTLNDLDIWFHWRVGQDLLAGQPLPDRNHYSYHEPQNPWHDHEWLFQALIASVGSVQKGPPPLPGLGAVGPWNALRIALALVLLWLLLADVRRPARPTETWGWAWGAVPILAGLALLWPRLVLRPELFSYIGLCLVVPAAEKAVASRCGPPDRGREWRTVSDPRRPLGLIVWTTVVWAQFHGFAVLGPVVLGIAVLLGPLQRRLDTAAGPAPAGAMLGAGFLLAVAALAVTPGLWRGLVYPLRALGQFREPGMDLRRTISELTPLLQSPNVLGWTRQVFLASLAWGIAWSLATWPRTSLLRVLLWVGAGAAAWSNQRSIGLYAVAFVLLHGSRAGALPPASAGWLRWRPNRRLGLWSGALTTAAIVAVWAPAIVQDRFYLHEGVARRFGGGPTPAQLPAAAAADLAARPQVRVFGNVDAAGFLLGNTPCRVFIDGRTEAYTPTAWSTYLRIKSGDEESVALLARQQPQAVCLTLGTGAFRGLANRLLANDRWTLAAADAGGLLFLPAVTPAAAGPTTAPADLLAAAGRQALQGPGAASSGARRADWCQGAANLFRLAGDTRSQEHALRVGLEARPDHPTLLHNLGNLVMDRQEYAEAAALFEAASRANPRLAGSAVNAGVCRMRLQQVDAAVRWFERALEIDRRSFQAWVNLAGALAALGHRDQAAGALERALALRPQDQALRLRLEELRRGSPP